MPRRKYRQEIYAFEAGPLGSLEGLTLSTPSASSRDQPQCHYFGGLPYALPPLGPYRFRRPRPLPEFYRYGTKASPGRFTYGTAFCPQPPGGGADESLWDEDCLQLNIFIPAGKPVPPNGWPVFFYIHGGFLQWGTANMRPWATAPLLGETDFGAIVVAPSYRLNVFGFIASKELQAEAERFGESSGNMGFWDQRMALEWTAANIRHFGGDPNNISVGGYSAGSHSACHQLAHELYFVPEDKAIIKRVIMWSNSPGVQPRTPAAHQTQFDELLRALKIPSTLSAGEKLTKLRAQSPKALIDAIGHLDISEFRATSDGSFVSKNFIANINNGDFGRRMKARGIRIMNGECRDEHFSYQGWRTPSQSYDAVRTRLIADYPESVVEKLMLHYCGKAHELPSGVKDWQDLFGRIYANMQVHCLERGFHHGLESGGLVAGRDILRYRLDWRAKCVNAAFPIEVGVTHGTDLAIWFWGHEFGDGLSDEDKAVLMPWNKAFAAFVSGEIPEWGTNQVKEMKRLRSDGNTDVWVDDQWEKGLELWNLVNDTSSVGVIGWIRAKL